MNLEPKIAAESAESPGGLFSLALLSLLAGAAAGLVGAVFRLSLDRADRWRDALIGWAHAENFVGLLLVIAICAAATGIAAWLVHRYSPQATGSGIPHVEAILSGALPQAPYRLIPVKFVGGVLAIGSGLALGREGPSVQMGASVANLLGVIFRRKGDDCKMLLAAGAGAGLATAFNAPIGGAVFVLEELVRRFDTRTTVVTFGASAGAIAVARLFLGDAPDFHVEPLPYPGFGTVPIHLALGIVAGCAGVAYNRAILGTLAVADRLHRWPVELRAALMGAAVATCATHDETLVTRLRGVMLFLGAAQLCLLLLAGLALHGGSPALERALDALIAGRTAAIFWGLAMGVGLGVPLVALTAMRQQYLVTMASALCLFAGAATLRFLIFTVA